MEEIEVKFLNIDPGLIVERLENLGAQKIFDRIFRRRVFDYPDLRLGQQHSFLRLRDEGVRITMTFKQRLGVDGEDGNDQGMREIEIEVNDFEKTARLLRELGFVEKFYEENRRISYRFEGIEFDIDYWPMLAPFLEIEGKNRAEVDRGIELLHLNPTEKKIFTTAQVYKSQGIRELDYSFLTLEKQVKKDKPGEG